MSPDASPTIHATAVLLDGLGVLIRGESGSGKSRLALALLDAVGCRTSPGAGDRTTSPNALIGDDWLALSHDETQALVSPGPNLAGLIEVRGIGILGLPWRDRAALHLLVDLKHLEEMERLPEVRTQEFEGQNLHHVAVPVGDLSHQCLLVRTALHLLAC